MNQTLRLAVLLSAFALLASACATEESIQEDWDAFVAEHSSCRVDADCALVYPGCPLGCFDAIRADAVEEADALADDLIGEWELGGTRNCEYDCVAPSAPYCDPDGKCAVDAGP